MTDVSVSVLRVAATAENYPEALAFYRDVLGLAQLAEFDSPDGHVVLLDAGRATLELTDPGNAAYVDQVEVGRRVAGPIRVAFQVADAAATADRLTAAGAELIAAPTVTPWNSRNARLTAPDGVQLTLFEELP